MTASTSIPIAEREFLVVCLCADWCGTCRDYEAGFKEMAAIFPEAGFLWVDIEDANSGVEDWDIENFPTLLIQRDNHVLFFGPMLPHHSMLRQMLATLMTQSEEETLRYTHATPERAGWQVQYDYRTILKAD